ncbi:MAG: M23 family metallopeptidase [Xanthomonadales bacterium]|nr:M23 family metallopeptidase [Xanthomonadales bacterium]
MNIILIRDGRSPARCVRLNRPSALAAMGCVAAVVLTVFGGLCFAVGRYWGDTAGISRAEVDSLRSTMSQQQALLDQEKAKAERDLQSLSAQLGALQADAMRLNALGQRLTKLGKLDDGEFDFGREPDLGGPESPPLVGEQLSTEKFTDSLRTLATRFDQQGDQLRLLESLLIGRDLDAATRPAGSPIKGGYISSGYGVRHDPFNGSSTFHSGLDFDGPTGGDIYAVASGVVTWSGRRPGYGLVVEIDHGNGYLTRYAHNKKNLVAVGDRVNANDKIGLIGSTGRATGSHVHFEVWMDGKPINPAKFTSQMRAAG